MKNLLLFVFATLSFTFSSTAQFDLGKIKGDVDGFLKKNKKGSLSESEIIDGLKEALTVGTNNSTGNASKADGYYKNAKIKIPFPPEAEKMKKTLVDLGMSKQVNEFILTLNRGAEEAAKEAAPVFINAIKGMTISDGLSILKGEDDEATKYLKGTTSPQLNSKFSPIVKKALEKVEVTKYWSPLITRYNKIPFVEKQNPDLDKYVTERAIAGLFKLIAEEELKIRQNPAARVTDLLKKVFGN